MSYKKTALERLKIVPLLFTFLYSTKLFSQTPTVSVNIDKTAIQEAAGKAVFTASLSAAHTQDVVVYLKSIGTAKYIDDFTAEFAGLGFVKTIVNETSGAVGASETFSPSDIFVDNMGNMYISDALNHRVQKWSPDATTGVTVAGGNGQGAATNQLNTPNGIFVDAVGNLYISDVRNHRVQKWSPGATEGITVAGGNGAGDALNQLNLPGDVFVDTDGNVFVTDRGTQFTRNDRVQKWSPGATTGITVAGGNGRGSGENQLNSPSGIFVDREGNLFISDSGNDRIQKWEKGATFGTLVAGGKNNNAPPKLWSPQGIFVNEKEEIFIADGFYNRIQKWKSGASTGTTVLGGFQEGSGSNELRGPLSVFLDNQGNIFVVDAGNKRVQKVVNQPQITIPAGQVIGNLTITAVDDLKFEDDELATFEIVKVENANISPTQPILSTRILDNDTAPLVLLSLSESTLFEEKEPIKLTVRLSNQSGKNTSVELNFTGTAVLGSNYTVDRQIITFVPEDSVETVLITPINDDVVEQLKTIYISVSNGLNISTPFPSDTLWFSSEDKPLVNHITLSKSAISKEGGTATLTATLAAAHSRDVIIALKSGGTAVYQQDYDVDFQGKGMVKTVAGGNGQGSSENQLNFPYDVFVDQEGSIFIADWGNHRVQKWLAGTSSGVTVAGGNGIGSAPNQLFFPNGIAVDNEGNVFISDQANNRIQKWALGATSGMTVAGGNGFGSSSTQLSSPADVLVDSEGSLYIADRNNHRIQKWSLGSTVGISIAGGKGFGSSITQLASPSGIFIDSEGSLFIADQSNNRVQKWISGASSGITVAGGNGQGATNNQFNSPYGVAVDRVGNIYVTDVFNNRVQKWSPSAISGVTVVGGDGVGSASNQLSNPYGIFIDSQDNLFIADQGNHRIQKVFNGPHIVIPAGQISGTLIMTALADSKSEEDKLVTFEISGIENGTVSPNQPVLQVIIGSLPPQPAAFTSSKEVVCRSTSFTYTIPAVDRATSYKWSFTEATPNATIAATSSTSATVTFGAGFTGATLNVVASNAYGDSPKRSISIQVGSAPAQPGVISASNSVVCQGSSRTYSIASVSGASSYVWNYTGTGATFSSTGTSVQVTYGASATGGEFRVQAVGECGMSTARTLQVNIVPDNIVLNGRLLVGSNERVNQQATRSILFQAASSMPISVENGAVFSAQIVGCPN